MTLPHGERPLLILCIAALAVAVALASRKRRPTRRRDSRQRAAATLRSCLAILAFYMIAATVIGAIALSFGWMP